MFTRAGLGGVAVVSTRSPAAESPSGGPVGCPDKSGGAGRRGGLSCQELSFSWDEGVAVIDGRTSGDRDRDTPALRMSAGDKRRLSHAAGSLASIFYSFGSPLPLSLSHIPSPRGE